MYPMTTIGVNGIIHIHFTVDDLGVWANFRAVGHQNLMVL